MAIYNNHAIECSVTPQSPLCPLAANYFPTTLANTDLAYCPFVFLRVSYEWQHMVLYLAPFT